MRSGFSVKEIASILDVAPTKATQAIEPALLKVARLFRADPCKAMAELADALDRLEQEAFEQSLPHREARLNGTANRAAVHQK